MKLDFHTHVFPPAFRADRARYCSGEPGFAELYDSPKARLAGVEDLISHMDAVEVDRSVIFGFPWHNGETVRRHNDYMMDAVQRYPGRLTGFCCFSPTLEEASKETERCLKSGCRGVGELAVYGDGWTVEVVDALEEVMAIALDFEVPVLLHTNEPVGHPYPGKTPMTLGQIYHLVRKYPLNRIVLAHWGGGLPFYELMKRDVKEALKNVWFDTAASPYLYDPRIYRVVGTIAGFDKILFGSDFPLLSPSRYFKEMEEAGLSTRERVQVSGENAARLLNLMTW
ncbi:MAG: amidohydrolase family protein [Desulfatiglandaceae bacterium]